MTHKAQPLTMETAKYIILVLSAFLAASCCPCKHISTDTTTSDSARVETREIYIEKIDTAYLTLPIEVVRDVTRDTSSTVETSAAISTAIITDGMLWHTIENKAVPIPVQSVTKEVVRDTTIYKNKLRTVTTKVEVPAQLTGWQRFQMYGFWVVFAIFVIFFTFFLARWIISKK